MIKLSKEQSEKLFEIISGKFFNYFRIIFELDQKAADSFKARNLHFHQKDDDSHGKSDQCCSQFYSKITIPKSEMTKLELLVSERTAFHKFVYDMPELLNSLAQTFLRVKSSGAKDSLNWNDESEKFVLSEVLKEGVIRFVVGIIRKEVTKEQNSLSTAPLLMATPASWKQKFPKIDLNFLETETLAKLMGKKLAIQRKFMASLADSLEKELVFLERDSRFEETLQERTIRNDRVLWLTLTDVQDAPEFPTLKAALTVLSALPFEINAKANLGLQNAESFQVSYFKEEGFQNKHLDSTFSDKCESGKKFSVIYLVSKFSNCSISFFSDSGDVIGSKKLKKASLTLLSSREISYAIKTSGKGFMIRQFINGPFN